MFELNTLKRLSAVALLGLCSVGAQAAANFQFTGSLTYNTDVVYIDFQVNAPQDVILWTDSWQQGLNFDPTLALFDASHNLVTIGDDTPDFGSMLPGQGGYDSQIRLGSLAAGLYRLALSASSNDANGPTLADGFSLQGTQPLTIAEWNQPSYDINKNDQKGAYWNLHVDGVDSASAVSAVPLPDELMLLMSGLTVLVGVARRKKKA
jgi:hypothetical protein